MKRTRKQKHNALLREARKHYSEYIEIQGGENCAICGREPGSVRLCIDHDHGTLSVRGLLCSRCNRFLRYWMSPDWLRKAADYLENPPLAMERGAEAPQDAPKGVLPLSTDNDSIS